MNNSSSTSSSTSTSLYKQWSHFYSGKSQSTYSLSSELEQNDQFEKKFTIKNVNDLREVLAQIPRKLLTCENYEKVTKFLNTRDLSLCVGSTLIFPDKKLDVQSSKVQNGLTNKATKIIGYSNTISKTIFKTLIKGNTIVDQSNSSFFNPNAHEKLHFLTGSKIGLRSEFEAVNFEPFKKLGSVYLNIKITVWDLSTSEAREKESWVVDLEKEGIVVRDNIEQELQSNTEMQKIHFDISEDGSWILITNQKNARKNVWIYSTIHKKVIENSSGKDLGLSEYLLPEGYLFINKNSCQFMPINEKGKAWEFQRSQLPIMNYNQLQIMDYNKDWVILKNYDVQTRSVKLHAINLCSGEAKDFPGATWAKLCDNFLITFNGKGSTIHDIRTLENYNLVPHFSERVIIWDVLIKTNKIYVVFTEDRKNDLAQLVQFEFLPPKKVTLKVEKSLFGKDTLPTETLKKIFECFGPVDLNVTIQVNREWRKLSRFIALTRLHSFLKIPGKTLLNYQSGELSYSDNSAFSTKGEENDLFLPTAIPPNPNEEQKEEIAKLLKLQGEDVDNCFPLGKNKYVIVTNQQGSCRYYVRTFGLDTGNVSSMKLYNLPISEFNYSFYQNGLLFFELIEVDDPCYTNLIAFSIEDDTLKQVWGKKFYQKKKYSEGLAVATFNEDYIVISAGYETTEGLNNNQRVFRPLTVLETNTGNCILNLEIDCAKNDDQEVFISGDMLGIQSTNPLNLWETGNPLKRNINSINLYHLTTKQFIAAIPIGNKEITDMQLLLDHPDGPRLRFEYNEKVNDSDRDKDDFQGADILLEYPKDIIATIPRTPPVINDVDIYTKDLTPKHGKSIQEKDGDLSSDECDDDMNPEENQSKEERKEVPKKASLKRKFDSISDPNVL